MQLQAAGFVDVEEIDLTAEFLATARRAVEFQRRFERELREANGDAGYEEDLADQEGIVAAVDEGLLRRSLLSATRP